MDLLYQNSNSTILIGFYKYNINICFMFFDRLIIFLFSDDLDESLSDFFQFDWKATTSQQTRLRTNSEQIAHLIVYSFEI